MWFLGYNSAPGIIFTFGTITPGMMSTLGTIFIFRTIIRAQSIPWPPSFRVPSLPLAPFREPSLPKAPSFWLPSLPWAPSPPEQYLGHIFPFDTNIQGIIYALGTIILGTFFTLGTITPGHHHYLWHHSRNHLYLGPSITTFSATMHNETIPQCGTSYIIAYRSRVPKD